MGANCASQGEAPKQCVQASLQKPTWFFFLFSVTSRKSSAGSKMVANTKEEENRQTNENGKQSFKMLLYSKLEWDENYYYFFCPFISRDGF